MSGSKCRTRGSRVGNSGGSSGNDNGNGAASSLVHLALHHTLDARKCIKRRVARRAADMKEARAQQAMMESMEAQMAELEELQASLAHRVAAEEAACRDLSSQLATMQAQASGKEAENRQLRASGPAAPAAVAAASRGLC